MKHKLFGIPLLVIIPILVFLLVGGAVIGAWQLQKEIPARIIIEGSGFTLYEDPACTVELTELNFASCLAGQASPKTFYLKNEGSFGLYGDCAWSGHPSLSKLMVGLEPVNIYPEMKAMWGGTLAPGDVKAVSLSLEVSASAPIGEATFTFYVVCKQ